MSPRKLDLHLQVQQAAPFPLDATLDCTAGELMALVGPSGSGKSTLLRLIAGLSRLPSGMVHSGKTIWADQHTHLPPQARRVGYVPQNYGLFPHMDALTNVESSLHHLPKPERTRVAHEWLERVHLTGLASRRPAALSGGQQQRVALARALAANPSALLLDEPFSAVDAATREKLYSEIVELREQLSMPILLVTHDLHEALILADKITLLSHGRTLQAGAPEDVMASPVNEDAARLLGLRNIFDARVLGHDPLQGHSLIQLGEHQLKVACQPHLPIGINVKCVVTYAGIRFRAITRQQTPQKQNRIPVTITSQLKLGDQMKLAMQLANSSTSFQVNIPMRLAQELSLQVGGQTDIVLRAENIHIFTGDDGNRG